jgi:hypothetical protein
MSDTDMSQDDLTEALAAMDEIFEDPTYTGDEESEEILGDPGNKKDRDALVEAQEEVAAVVTQPPMGDVPSPTGRFQPSFSDSTPIGEAPAPVDNVEAAMDKLAETLEPKVSTSISDDDGPADKQVLIRSTSRDHERWKLAAEREGTSLSAFIRELVNSSVSEILDCSHPMEFRQTYPWSETCLKCGTRLRDGGDNSPNSAAGRRG